MARRKSIEKLGEKASLLKVSSCCRCSCCGEEEGGPKLFCLCCRGKTRLVTLRGRRGHRERSLSLDSRRERERRERKEREGEKQSGFFLLFSFLALTRAHNRSRYSSPLPSVFSFQRPSLSRGGKASTRGLDCYCTRQIPSLSPLPHSKRAG